MIVERRWEPTGAGCGPAITVGTLHRPMLPHAMSARIAEQADALCGLAHWAAARGWVPATSGNFSVRDPATGHIYISCSGLDKGRMTPADLLELDARGGEISGSGKPSAESGLHVVVYGKRPRVHAIAHVHTIWNTLLSARYVDAGRVEIAGYELLKALSGVE